MIYHHPAKEKGLGYSLFQRYTEILDRDFDMTLPGDSILMLTTQYRMVLGFIMFLILFVVIVA